MLSIHTVHVYCMRLQYIVWPFPVSRHKEFIWEHFRSIIPFLRRLTHRNVSGCAGDPLFGEEKAEGQNQEFTPQFAAVAVA